MDEIRHKLAIVVRKDLKMAKGKIAAQASHASVMASEVARKRYGKWWKSWLRDGQCKVALKVGSETELNRLRDEAEETGLPTVVVTDMGLTQVPPGTTTCIGIGPAPSELVDKITKDLPLL